MNIAIILSGGVGNRFGSKIPKQYLDLCGKPVINYVLDVAYNSQLIDEIVLVMDKQYLPITDISGKKKTHIVENGKERINSVRNALDYIKENIPRCKNVIILQAVSPFVSVYLVDKYLNLLDDYDVVTTAEKIVGELFNKNRFKKIKRDDYYFCQSPEAFKFNDLYRCANVNSEYTELIYHYDFEPKIYYNLDFDKNIKLTYRQDLEYAKFLMKEKIQTKQQKKA
ncbi:2-C-methyl-D-erythritol 4-phosphate cytidylyltransferase [Candidatus Saccharibacteria bacterium]|nr:2-C-methyl-D-erythritol 4-phosphate cytidylyltransferase [Candidatus Saccharibacteria bacterium]